MVIPVSLFSDRSGEKPGDQGGPGAFVEPLGPGGVERRLERQVGRRVGKSNPPPHGRVTAPHTRRVENPA